jgi:O-antigen/teichoic acid export membrane protein
MRVGPAFLQTFASQVIQSAASITTGILIARGLGPAGQGRYALFAAALGLVATFAAAGQFEGHVLTSAGDRSWGRVLLTRSLIQTVAAVTLTILTQRFWRQALGLQANESLAILIVLVLLAEVLALLFRGINLGQHHIVAYNITTLTQRLCFFAIVATLTAAHRVNLQTVLAAWLASATANVVLGGLWIWQRSGRTNALWAGVRNGWQGSLSRGFKALVTISLTLVLVRTDIYMIGPMLGVDAVGQVSVASTLAEYLWYIPSILGSVLFAAVAANRGQETVAKICRASRTVVAVLVPVGLALAFGGRWLVPFIYGRAYVQAGTLFVLLLPGMLAISLHLVVDAYFTGTGFPPITYLSAAGAVAVKVLFNLALVPTIGLPGAAVATSVAYVLLLVVKVTAFRRATGVGLMALVRPTWRDIAYNIKLARAWIPTVTGNSAGAT